MRETAMRQEECDRVDEVDPGVEDSVGVLRLDRGHAGAVEHRGGRRVRLEERLHLLLDFVVHFVPLERLRGGVGGYLDALFLIPVPACEFVKVLARVDCTIQS